MSNLNIQSIGNRTGSGTITLSEGTNIKSVSNTIYSGPGSVVQTRYFSTMPTSHLTGGTVVPLLGEIKPVFADSVIWVKFWSTMLYGAGGWLISTLSRSIDKVSYDILTPDTRTSRKYAYSWNYTSNGWHSPKFYYFDVAGTTDTIYYKISTAQSGTNYLVHQYMEYGWELMEIKRS
jgi:hypothetical protein